MGDATQAALGSSGPTLAVAPREITDLVFRASRVAGCDASVADRVAADVRHAEVHHGTGLVDFIELLDAGPGVLDNAAGAAIMPGPTTPPLLRGRTEHRQSDASIAVERAALRRGVFVDRAMWGRVESVAERFLLSEAVIDAG